MKAATVKDLRNRTSTILAHVRNGGEVIITLRGKSIAVIKPMGGIEKPFSPVGFGMWKGRREMTDVKNWLDEWRKERYLRWRHARYIESKHFKKIAGLEVRKLVP